MPLYDYEVLDAAGKPTGEVLEAFQHMRDPALCELEGKPVRRMVTAPTVRIGAGFAVNYGSDKLPASRSLPRRPTSGPEGGEVVTRGGKRVRKYKDGGFANLQGQPIVNSRKDRDREKGRSGAVEAAD